MFILQLPSFVFFCFHGKRYNFQKSSHLHAVFCLMICIGLTGTLFSPRPAEGAFMEGIAVDARAISLANNVTASPPGTASIYYNPAGLSLMGDGAYISLGLILPVMKIERTFEQDPNFEKFHYFDSTDTAPHTYKDPVAGTSDTSGIGKMYLPILDDTLEMLNVPTIGFSYRKPGSKWTFGYSIYVPFGGGWTYEDDDPSRWGGKEVYLQHLIYCGPGVSYRISKTLSVGASLGLGQTAMGINMDARAPNEMVNITKVLGDATQRMGNPIFDLTIPMPLFGGGMGPYDKIGSLTVDMQDDFSPSYNLGILWEPFDWLAFGLDYQSKIKSHMSGKYKWEYSKDWQKMVAWDGSTAMMQIISMIFDLPYTPAASQEGTATFDMEWPQIVNFGIKVKPIKRLSILADLHWAEWSSVVEDKLTFDQKIQLLQFAKFMGYAGGAYQMKQTREFDDTLNWGVGIEYQALDWLSLRAGYENRTGSTQDQYFDFLMALPSVDYYGAGLGINGAGTGIKMLKDIDIDLSLGYLVNKSYYLPSNTASNLNSTVLGAGLNNPYAGLDIEQSTEIYLGAVKATMPLHIVTDLVVKGLDLVNPFSKPASGGSSLKTTEDMTVSPRTPVEDPLRIDGQSYFTGDSE